MAFRETDVNQVKLEIMDIINRYPDRTGGDIGEYGDKDCVYFKDKNGMDVGSYYGEYIEPERLTIPVCIVGQWIHDFHPELKEDETFQDVLFHNAILSTSREAADVLGPEIHELLSNIQGQQDNAWITWRDLEF